MSAENPPIGSVLSAVAESSGGTGVKNSTLSSVIPDKFKHWGVVVSGHYVISMDGDGYLVKESLSDSSWSGREIHSWGDEHMAQAAQELYDMHRGKVYLNYFYPYNDCQTFITNVRARASNNKNKTLNTVLLCTGVGAVGQSLFQGYHESMDTACAWADKADSKPGKIARAVVAGAAAPVLAIAKTPGYIWAKLRPSNW